MTKLPYLDVGGGGIVCDLKQTVENITDYFVSANGALNGRFLTNTQQNYTRRGQLSLQM